MALPFVVGITVLLLVLITVIGVIAITDQKNQQQQEAKQYEQRAVDVVNNFLDQQDAFAKQLASPFRNYCGFYSWNGVSPSYFNR